MAGIEARGLRKTYPGGRGQPRIQALDGLSLAVGEGQIYGLLGPNGAGKSTTVKVLSTLSRADSGSALVAGVDVARHPDQVRRLIGLVAQHTVADPTDTGRENLCLAGRLQAMSARAARARAAELLARFGLDEVADRLVKTYSGGMRRKLDLAIGLMHRPRVLFLDEPTTGLDPQGRLDLWRELEAMSQAEAMTVLLTTHYLEEADRLAQQISIIDHGQVVVAGSPEELKDGLHGDTVLLQFASPADARRAGAVLGPGSRLREMLVEASLVRGRANSGAGALPHLLAAVEAAGLVATSATVARPSLDDVYLRHTGRTYAGAQPTTEGGLS